MPDFQESALGKTAEEQVMELEKENSRLRATVARLAGNVKEAAQRWGRQSRVTAEDLAGNATDRIKRDPVRSVAIGFAIGLSLGALMAWSLLHESRALRRD